MYIQWIQYSLENLFSNDGLDKSSSSEIDGIFE